MHKIGCILNIFLSFVLVRIFFFVISSTTVCAGECMFSVCIRVFVWMFLCISLLNYYCYYFYFHYYYYVFHPLFDWIKQIAWKWNSIVILYVAIKFINFVGIVQLPILCSAYTSYLILSVYTRIHYFWFTAAIVEFCDKKNLFFCWVLALTHWHIHTYAALYVLDVAVFPNIYFCSVFFFPENCLNKLFVCTI